MRLLIKLILIAVLFAVLYHFFGPQIDHLWLKAKTELTAFVTKHHDESADNNADEDHKYFKLEKREKGAQ